jgi:hypothetical protein
MQTTEIAVRRGGPVAGVELDAGHTERDRGVEKLVEREVSE